MKILLVEDEPVILLVTQLMLKEFNCEVTAFSSGIEALAWVRLHTVDLCLIDIGLPDIDGFALSKEIRKLIEYQNVPIAIVTAHDCDNEYWKEAQQLGIDDYLLKPLTHEKLSSLFKKYEVGQADTKA